MATLYVENFEAGLDTRKSRFTAPPGALIVLKNAHITRGKEIERRKAFATMYTLPASTFGLHAAQGVLYTFGSATTPAGMPVGVTYQRLQHPGGNAMVRVLDSENFDGKPYVIAEYGNGDVYHFYSGSRVTDWDAIGASVGSKSAVATALGAKLDTDGAADVAVVDDRMVLTGVTPGVAFSISVSADLSLATLQSAQAAVPEVRASASFTITGGTEGQTFNTVARVAVNGADLMGAAIDWATSNEATATAVADQINAYVTSYTASASGATVTVQATPGLGVSANGYTFAVTTTGDVTVTADSTLSGGTDPIPAIPQISQVTVSTFAAATSYRVTLEGTQYFVTGRASGTARTVRAVQQKMYAVTQSLLYFSGFVGNDPDPKEWDAATTGAGFINLSTQYAGSDNLVGIGIYQRRVAAFSRRAVQIWTVDPDPALNTAYQVLLNVGAVAPRSIVEYGDLDIFFLSESGLRSLRARDSSNLASASDVGVAIDAELTAYMRTLTRAEVHDAVSVVEPQDGRYMVAVGGRVYVLSSFPGSKVAAWSTYDLGGTVSAWAVTESRLYARIGDTVRLYGGTSGIEYDDSETEVVLPFLDGSNPSGDKQFTGLDVGIEGQWSVEMASEPNDPDEWETVAELLRSTYGSERQNPLNAESTHLALRLRSNAPGPARLGNLLIHYVDLGGN